MMAALPQQADVDGDELFETTPPASVFRVRPHLLLPGYYRNRPLIRLRCPRPPELPAKPSDPPQIHLVAPIPGLDDLDDVDDFDDDVDYEDADAASPAVDLVDEDDYFEDDDDLLDLSDDDVVEDRRFVGSTAVADLADEDWDSEDLETDAEPEDAAAEDLDAALDVDDLDADDLDADDLYADDLDADDLDAGLVADDLDTEDPDDDLNAAIGEHGTDATAPPVPAVAGLDLVKAEPTPTARPAPPQASPGIHAQPRPRPNRPAARSASVKPAPTPSRAPAPKPKRDRLPLLLTGVIVVLLALLGLAGVFVLRDQSHSAQVGPSGRTSTPPPVSADVSTQAVSWARTNLPTTAKVLADPTTRTELVGLGFSAANVSAIGDAGTASTSRFAIVTPAVRAAGATPGSSVASLLANALPVAVFGNGQDRVEVSQIGAMATSLTTAQQTRLMAGQALLKNPALHVIAGLGPTVGDGRLDMRAETLLAILANQASVALLALPQASAEARAGAPVRTIVFSLGGDPGAADKLVGATIHALPADLTPYQTSRRPDGSYQIVWLPDLALTPPVN